MTSRVGPLFISYSRRDYYVAESLSFHLHRRGLQPWMDVKDLAPGADWQQQIDAAIDGCEVLILIASPAAMDSGNVTREWQRAQAGGKRIVLLGWYRRPHLPPALQGCEWLDFRGRFGAALHRLVATLMHPQTAAPAGPHPGQGPMLPPAVAALVLALALPFLGMLIGVVGGRSWQDLSDRLADTLLNLALSLFLFWFLWLSLLQRKMGMTRMLACLVLLTVPYAHSAWARARHGAAGLPYQALDWLPHAWLLWVLGALPVLGIAMMFWLRPADLLHWASTGGAWSSYRLAAAERSRVPMPDAASALGAVRSFQLLHDAADQPLAMQLRSELLRLGATEAAATGPGATHIVLLSNHATLDWLEREVRPRATGPLLTVVGSAIRPDPALDWLWRSQWIDLRGWAVRRADAEQGLPRLPEAVQTLKLPRAVARLHAALCAFAATLFMVVMDAAKAARPASTPEDELSAVMVCIVVSLPLTGWAARQIARRSRRSSWLMPLIWAGLAIGNAAALLTALGDPLPPREHTLAWVGVALCMGLSVLALREGPQVRFWLPQPPSPQPSEAQRLIPAGDWRTFGTLAAFVALATSAVQILAPG